PRPAAASRRRRRASAAPEPEGCRGRPRIPVLRRLPRADHGDLASASRAGEPSWYRLRVRPFVRGDVDGFFGLALDNLVQLRLVDALWRAPYVLGFSAELVRATILPRAAAPLVVGTLFYARQAP